ncbi:isochorismatase family protein [Methanoregula sp.]|uniref:isochorismatase family protein n=1 Tax=Methanoregula sp. TaxID=2052170 RepID=UPI003C793AC5
MISLRPLQEPDISIIKSWPSYPAEFSGLDYALRDRGWLDEYVGKKGTEIFVAEDSGTLVGFSILTCEKGGSAEFRIALHPEWVGHGLGKTITRLTLRQGFSHPDIWSIRLIVRKTNLRAQNLYTSLSFQVVGECTEEIQGKPVEFYQMIISRDLFFAADKSSASRKTDGKEAVLVIDVQNEYFTGNLPVTYPQGSINRILSIMDAAHDHHIPIVVIQHANTAPDAKTFRRGTPGFELLDEIRNHPYDVRIEKTLPGSFTGTELDAWLKQHEIVKITIVGYMTQMCCDTTARQAFHRGFTVQFIADATGTLDITNNDGTVKAEELHRAICVTQAMRFSTVMMTRDWIADLN